MKYKPHSSYKESGFDSVGLIPAPWSVSALGRLGRFSASGIDKNTVQGETPVHMVNYTDVYSSVSKKIDMSTEYMQTTCPSWKAKQHSLKIGDILFTPSSETEAEIGFSAVVTEDMPQTVYSYHLTRLRPNKGLDLDVNYSKYLGNNAAVLSQFTAACKGTTRQILTREDFRTVSVVLPPVEEQVVIAAFLDCETAKIDALIEKKERLIELLKEKRTALITQAVTKGLDPKVPMKDSGVEWLGKIPAHWNVRRIKDAGRLVAGAGFPHDYQGTQGEELQFYKVRDLTESSDGVWMREGPNSISSETAITLRASIIPEGAILWAKIGAALFLNRRRISTQPCCIDNNMTAYIPSTEKIVTTWAFYWTSTLDFGELANPGAVPSLSEGYQSILPFIIPTRDEQKDIADFLDHEVAKIDALIFKIHDAITKLKEYRTALISAAVTGKIDVRDSQSPGPSRN